MNSRLRTAAEKGDTNELYECILQDPNVLRSLDNYEFVDTPLHIAAAGGHADFVAAILNLKPSFARKLNQDVYSPIHLALEEEHKTTMLRLLEFDKDLVRVKGKDGYTILHQAAERGNLQLLAEFLKICPASIEDVTIRNETALHIAAKKNRFEALQLLARWLRRGHLYSKASRLHLLNSKDSNGNTALHIAAFTIQPQMIKILVECGADTRETNTRGLTAVDIIENQSIGTQDKATSLTILRLGKGVVRNILHHAGFSCLIGTQVIPRRIKPLHVLLRSKISYSERLIMGSKVTLLNLSAERINVLLVVLALILTATFQAVNSPPGGVWQGDASQSMSEDSDYTFIGTSVMSPSNFYAFVALNISVFALTTIFTISLLEFVCAGFFMMFLVELLLSSFTCCFLFAVLVIDPSSDFQVTGKVVLPIIFCGMFAFMEICRRFLSFVLPHAYQDLTVCFRDM